MFFRFKIWMRWQKYCINSWYYKYLVLFGITRSPTFETIYEHERLTKGYEQWRKEKK